MKKSLIFLLALLGLHILFAQSTDYVPFPTQKTKWFSQFKRVHYMGMGGHNAETRIVSQHYFDGNTFVMNGNTYFQMLEESGSYWHIQGPPPVDTIYNYVGVKVIGGFREADKKVYFWSNEKAKEILMYDFNLNVGSVLLDEDGRGLRVSSIHYDTLADGKAHKVFDFKLDMNSNNIFQVAEGLGGLRYTPYQPFVENYFTDIFSDAIEQRLLGVCQNQQVVYGNVLKIDCNETFENAYPYHPFPLENVKWFTHTFEYQYLSSDTQTIQTNYLYTYTGNTFTQNGNTYHTLTEESSTQTKTAQTDVYQYIGIKELGGFREKDKKVYFWDFATNTEYLVYDFALLYREMYNFKGLNYILTQTGSTEVSGEKYRTYHFTQDSGSISDKGYDIMEGVGSLQSAPHLPFLQKEESYTNGKIERYFDAFCKAGTLILQSNSVSDCKQKIGKEIVNNLIYPNPVKETAHIVVDKLTGNAPKIMIYDVNGNMVQMIHLAQTSVEIKVENWTTGIYFVRYVSDSDNKMIGKLAVER